jgi:hypothetical protein
MTSFLRVQSKNLKIGKKYLVKEEINACDHIYLFRGKIEKIENDGFGLLGLKIYFTRISSLLISESIKNYSVYSSKCIFYEYDYTKKNIQKKMEERSLRDIMRNIIGDDTFIHYLFDDIIDYEVLDENIDNKLSKKTEIDIQEIQEFEISHNDIEFINLNNHNYEYYGE